MPIESGRAGDDERAALLPPEVLPLIDDGFVHSCDLFEGYVFRLARRVFRSTGLGAAYASPATAAEAIARAGLDPHTATIPVDWILRELVWRGTLGVEGSGATARYTLVDAGPDPDPEELRSEQAQHDPRALPSYAIAALAAEHYPAVLRGETTGEQALFGVERMAAWSEYFANENILYAISNALGAMACEAALRREGGAVLELGGGLGSGAACLCDRLATAGTQGSVTAYRFTEMSIPFLRRAQKSLAAAWPGVPFAFARLDMNRPFAEAGATSGGFALVHAVNALHVAHDLAFTLGQIREALTPGGALVATECVRPIAGRPVYVEFVFNLLEAFQRPLLVPSWRPTGGFLTPEQWTEALHENGFRNVRLLPDIVAIRDAYPSFVVAAITARRA
jgi:SAM-dependent methyltransferase